MDFGKNGYPPSTSSNDYGARSQGDVSRPDPLRPSPPMSKAEKFEDEKRRIISSCFFKRDEANKLVQSYITHVRVEEDAAYQSEPPPHNSDPSYKKPRVIILAVKVSSGRVSMHKARENDDGTFQIGKTWGLEELQSIESFSNNLPKTPDQEERASRAGSVGFIINMSKPYYWQTRSPKEKDFFVGSLVKVYNKFTSGQLPLLIGFDQKDHDAILASTRNPPSGSQPQQQPGSQPRQPSIPSSLPPRADQRQLAPPPPKFGGPAPSERPSLGSDYRPGSNYSGNGSMLSVDPRAPSPVTRQQNGSMGGPRPYQMNRRGTSSSMTSSNQSQPPARNLTPQSINHPSYDALLNKPVATSSYPSASPNSVQPSQPSRLTPQDSRTNISDTSISSIPPTNSHHIQHRTSERSLNMRYETPQLPSSLTPGSATSSTTDRWRPPLNDDSTTDSWRTPPESTSMRSRHEPAQIPANNAPTSVPERRRPPLQDSVYSDSNQSLRSDTSAQHASTPVAATLNGPFVEDETLLTPIMSEESPDLTKSAHGERDTTDIAPPSPLRARQQLDPSTATENTNDTQSPQDTEEKPQYRPGLGPMMGKKAELASKLRKAANAHRAFVPRAGGAGDRLLGQANRSANEPDGVTGVVLPVRSLAREMGQDDRNPQPVAPLPLSDEKTVETEKRLSPLALVVPQQRSLEANLPLSENIAPQAPSPESISASKELGASQETMPQPLMFQRPSDSIDRLRLKKKANPFARAFELLGVENSLSLDRRVIDFEDQLNEFGWERNFLQRKQFDAMQAKMRREISTIEAGSWLGHTEDGDARIEAFEKSIDKAINAVDDADGLLTLYSVELSTLVDDVAYIEAQSQGLQVQTANQKLLHAELEDLLDTVSLNTNQLDALRTAPLDDSAGIDAIERSLAMLYKALEKIDPFSIKRSNGLQQPMGDSSAHGMRALQDRKQLYLSETALFLQRLQQFSAQVFPLAFAKAKSAPTRSSILNNVDTHPHDHTRAELWKYSPLMLFAKELDPRCWDDIIRSYQTAAGNFYGSETDEVVTRWRRKSQKPSSDYDFALFTTPEKETETFSSAARKMTVKRSATLAKSFRNTPQRERSVTIGTSHGELPPHEAFFHVLDEYNPVIRAEQNFMTDFFHVTVLDSGDFLDSIANERPTERRGADILSRRSPEPAGNRDMAGKIHSMAKVVFSIWAYKIRDMVEWAVNHNDFQRIGVLGTLERARLELEDSNQEFLTDILKNLFDTTRSPFDQWIEMQIKAIDNVKVKTNKRRGLMSFTRRLPNFANAVENTLPNSEASTPRNTHYSRGSDIHSTHREANPETRAMVEKAYERIMETIFKNLETIAKGTGSTYSSAATGLSVSADAEDKEKLNHEILLIENMHHIATNLDPGPSQTLGIYRDKAATTMGSHRDRYVDAIVRRPLGRLLDFLETVGERPRRDQISQGRSAFKKALSGYDARACRRDVEALKKRVEKHFTTQEGQVSGDAVISAGHSQLIVEILEACRARFEDAVGRVEYLAGEYEPPVEVEISRQDVVAAFRR